MANETKTMEYTHLKLEEDNRCIAGSYTPGKEGRMEYKGREVLYVLGQANLDSSCCGSGCWCYTNVPGYIVRYQYKTNQQGLPVSEIELIRDKEDQEEIKKRLREYEPQAQGVCEIYFW